MLVLLAREGRSQDCPRPRPKDTLYLLEAAQQDDMVAAALERVVQSCEAAPASFGCTQAKERCSALALEVRNKSHDDGPLLVDIESGWLGQRYAASDPGLREKIDDAVDCNAGREDLGRIIEARKRKAARHRAVISEYGRWLDWARKKTAECEEGKIRADAAEREKARASELAALQAAEAKRRAEEEQRRKAAEQARLQAEAEAKRRAEEEARRRAEEGAKRRAAEEARRRAEEEARRRAAEEAKRRAEEEARRRAEEERRRKTEEEERRREEAEEQARREREKQEEERRRLEEEKRRAEEEAREKAERERREAEQRAREEEERRRREEEAAREAAERQAREEAEARLVAERRAQKEALEQKKRELAEAEKSRAEKVRAQIEERRKAEEERRRQVEEQRKAKEQAEAQAARERFEAWQKKVEAERIALNLAEEERLRLQAEDRARFEAEEAERRKQFEAELEQARKLEEEQRAAVEREIRQLEIEAKEAERSQGGLHFLGLAGAYSLSGQADKSPGVSAGGLLKVRQAFWLEMPADGLQSGFELSGDGQFVTRAQGTTGLSIVRLMPAARVWLGRIGLGGFVDWRSVSSQLSATEAFRSGENLAAGPSVSFAFFDDWNGRLLAHGRYAPFLEGATDHVSVELEGGFHWFYGAVEYTPLRSRSNTGSPQNGWSLTGAIGGRYRW